MSAGGSGSLLAMPLLIINMGGEMVYVLEQRLRAQSIPVDKSKKVLIDVVRAMYSTKFIQELFRPQSLYSNQSTRHVFDRLAHSSIMRLNQTSMDKLYDLMSMGFKYQVLLCTYPQQLLQVTLNHLESLKAIVRTSQNVVGLLDQTILLTVNTYASLAPGEFDLLKQMLCRFFQDRRVKVSLFLQESLQEMDGTLVLRKDGPVPPGSDAPGLIRYLGDDGEEVEREEHFSNAVTPVAEPPVQTATFDDASAANCTLGLNFYSRARAGAGAPAPAAGAAGDAAAAAAAEPSPSQAEIVAAAKRNAPSPTAAAQAKGDPGAKPASRVPVTKSTAAAELSLLANLIGGDADAKPFRLALFAGDNEDDGGAGYGDPVPTISFDAAAESKTAADYMDELDLGAPSAKGAKGGSVSDDEADDLLSLMDSA